MTQSKRPTADRNNYTIPFLLAIGFLLSTYFIAYAGANNYAMRGAIIPVFVLGFAISSRFKAIPPPRKATIALLILLALGSLNETLMLHNNLYSTLKHKNDADVRSKIYKLNTDRSITAIKYSKLDETLKNALQANDRLFYLVEKKVMYSPRALCFPDIEIMSEGPFFIWKYQDWNNATKQ